MSHIQLNYAFLLFWSIFWLIHWKLLFLVQKVIISESSTEILRNLFFLTSFKGANLEKNLKFCKQLFLIIPVKGTNIIKNCFSPKNWSHTPKLCFPVFFKHFRGNSLKNSLFLSKVTISERSSEILRLFVFLNKFDKEQI